MLNLAPHGPPASADGRNLNDVLSAAAQAAPKHSTLLHRRSGRREVVPLRTLQDEVRTIAAGIAAASVQPGDRVAVLAQPSAWSLVATLACWHAGAVVVPLSPTDPASLIDQALTDSGAVAVFTDPASGGIAEQLAGRQPNVRAWWSLTESELDQLASLGTVVGSDDLGARTASAEAGSPASIVYATARDGNLRGSVLSHAAICSAAEQIESFAETLRPTAPVLIALPPSNPLSYAVALALLARQVPFAYAPPESGGTGVLAALADWSAGALATDAHTWADTLQEAEDADPQPQQPWVLDAAATLTRHMLPDRPAPARRLPPQLADRLSVLLVSGTVLSAEQRRRLRSAEVTLQQAVGSARTCGLTAFGNVTEDGWVGPPMPGVEVRCDSGELLLRAPHVSSGFFNDWAATAADHTADGWLRTGEFAECDGDGSLRFQIDLTDPAPAD